jgi:cytochrome c oxidase subunit 3
MAVAVMEKSEEQLRKEKGSRNMLLLGIFSMTMVFGGLTSAYVVRQKAGDWFSIELPPVFTASTAVIILSSVSIILAGLFYKRGNSGLGTTLVGVTFLFGMAFTYFQFEGWGELVKNGIFLSPDSKQVSLISGSFIYVLTGLHLVHLGGGLLVLLFTFIKGLLGKYSADNYHGVKLAGIYWHFLDALWIYLFLFLTIFK